MYQIILILKNITIQFHVFLKCAKGWKRKPAKRYINGGLWQNTIIFSEMKMWFK